MTLVELIAAFERAHPDWGWDVGVMKNGRYNAIVWPKDASRRAVHGKGDTPSRAIRHAIREACFERKE